MGASYFLQVGVFWSPAEFIERARSAQHPYNLVAEVSPEVSRNLFHFFTKGPACVGHKMAEALSFWWKRAADLQPRERALHEAMNPEVAKFPNPSRQAFVVV